MATETCDAAKACPTKKRENLVNVIGDTAAPLDAAELADIAKKVWQGPLMKITSMSHEEQAKLVFEAYPRLDEDIWNAVKSMFPLAAAHGCYQAKIRIDMYSDMGPIDPAVPVAVRRGGGTDSGLIVVSIGVFTLPGCPPMSIPLSSARGFFSEELRGRLVELARADGFDACRKGDGLFISWMSEPEALSYADACHVPGGLEAVKSGVPPADVLAGGC